MIKFDPIEDVIADIKLGKMVIVVDDENRENEGDFVMAADMVSPEAINFMAKYGRGIICSPISLERANELGLELMVRSNNSSHETAFTVTVDLDTCTTGVSAAERSETIKALCDKNLNPSRLVKPGHIFPLIAKDGGVLVRQGHTEAAVDLARLSGFSSAGVICEIMNDDGTMARGEELYKLAQEFNLKFMKIEDLVAYRRKNEVLVAEVSKVSLPTKHGEFAMHMFEGIFSDIEQIVCISKGNIANSTDLLVRVHSECLTGDVFGSLRCDCGEQLESSMKAIEDAKKGLIIYLKQEGRGIGLLNKLKAYELQESGYDTVSANNKLGFEADLREYYSAGQIIKYFNISSINLMTNNPLKLEQMSQLGSFSVKRLSIEVTPNENNLNYLTTKRDQLGHLILN